MYEVWCDSTEGMEMKKKDITLNKTTVFIKKDRGYNSVKEYKVIELKQKRRSGSTVWAILNNKEGTRISISNLTDVPCHVMTCANCKYHPRN